MKIKKNMKFVCIKDVLMEGSREVNYVKGDVYISEQDGAITNMLGERGHSWTNPECQNFFIPYSQLDRVYTKHTPLLEKIFDKYEGKKQNTDGHVEWYCNCDTTNNTGWFTGDGKGVDMENFYSRNNYTYLSEKAFIEFMDLGKYIGSLNTDEGDGFTKGELDKVRDAIDEAIFLDDNGEANDFKDITDSIAELLQYKNTKYGNSALEPLKIFSDKCKVGTRIDDKLARIKHSESLKKNDVADLIGYCVLICKENGWNNFDEFKD